MASELANLKWRGRPPEYCSQNIKPGDIEFVDVNAAQFERASNVVSRMRALAVLHGRIGDQPTIKGVEAFSEAYRRTDLHVVNWMLSRRWLRPLLDFSYGVFAPRRELISKLLGPIALAIVKRCYRNLDRPSGDTA